MKRHQPDRGHPQAPFETREQWEEFAEAMHRLRDPNEAMLVRGQLLRIGEAIEARQLPHAQRQGWTA